MVVVVFVVIRVVGVIMLVVVVVADDGVQSVLVGCRAYLQSVVAETLPLLLLLEMTCVSRGAGVPSQIQ